MALTVGITRQHLIDIGHRANALPLMQPTQQHIIHGAAAPIIHQISPMIISMLAKVHISAISRYYLNYSHTLYGHIMQINRGGRMSGGLMSGGLMSGGLMSTHPAPLTPNWAIANRQMS